MIYRLGDLTFGAEADALEMARSWRFPRHDAVGRKPHLQYTGPDADRVDLSIWLHALLMDVDGVLSRLRAAGDAGRALPLSRGDGLALGDFVIERLTETHRQSFPDGQPILVKARLSLLESTGADRAVSAVAQPGRADARAPATQPVTFGPLDPDQVTRR